MPTPRPFGMRSTIIFLVLFGAFCSVLEYGRVLHLRPQPHHIWRQTIALSITRNYHDQHRDFLDGQVSNLYLDDGWSGKAAAEFPLLYYGVAKLWTLTGRSEFAYRLVMLLLHVLGAWALFATLRKMFGHTAPATAVALIFLSAPALVYFAIGFMTEVPALDLLLLGLFALALHRERRGGWSLGGAMLLFTLAGLLKVTAMMVPLTLMLVLLVELVFPARTRRLGHLFTEQRWMAMLLLAVVCATVWTWYAYTLRYNHLHHGSFSNQEVQPPWRMGADELARAWRFGSTLLPGMVHHWSVWLLTALALTFLLVRHRGLPIGLLACNGALVTGTALYTVLFFPALNEHDYYFILPLVMPWCLIASALWALGRQWPGLLGSKWTLVALGALAVLNMAYAREDHLMRTRGGASPVREADSFPLHTEADLVYWQESQWWTRGGLMDIEPYSRSIGIAEDDTVICIPDHSVCAALYLAGQRGWQNFGTLHDLGDSLSMALYRDRGAKYLYVLEEDWLKRPYMKAFTRHPVGEHRGVKIYDLRGQP